MAVGISHTFECKLQKYIMCRDTTNERSLLIVLAVMFFTVYTYD
jgi:hypothetical protein